MKKRILILILILSVILPQGNIIAETTGEEVSDVLQITLSPENYATIHITKTGYSEHIKYAKDPAVYYNTLYTAGNVYAEFGSVISSYKVPFKNSLTGMSINYYVEKGGMKTKRTIPVVYDFEKFSINAEPGIYKETEANSEYSQAIQYTSRYWPKNNKYGYSGKNLAYSILETETGKKTYDVTATAMAAFVAENNTSDYITFATGRETDQYANGSFKHDTKELIPTLTLTYSKSGVLKSINSVTKEGLPDLIENIALTGLLSNTAMGADAYKTLIASAKTYVNDKIYESISAGGFADFESFYESYDTHVEYAVTNGMLLAINSAKSTDEMISITDELGMSGALDNTKYTGLTKKMKEYVANSLYEVVLTGGFSDLSVFRSVYDKAVLYVSEIKAQTLPENYATIHITKDGYNDHKKYAKKLSLYYNMMYTGNVYAEFGSVISSFNLPFKNSVTDMDINYYVIKGGMQSERTIPVFYDYNKFHADIEPGKYSGPIEATDTTDAVEASDEYKEILEYAKKYWPASGYSPSKTEFSSKIAFEILETQTGTKTYNLKNILPGFIKSDSDYITFATGRETNQYANGAIDVSSEDKKPTLSVTYDTVSLLNEINITPETDMIKLIENLGKSGLLDVGEKGYKKFLELSNSNKSRAVGIIYDTIKNNGYQTFDEFISAYDTAVENCETIIKEVKISDSEKNYYMASDAAGKEVTITASIKFAEKSGTYKAVLAEYEEGKLLSAETKDIPFDSKEITFTKTLSPNVTDAKIMVMNSVSGMKPICKSANDRLGVLDGKKVIFIGNSHTYRGMTVVEKELDILDQASRSKDTGYFYQLCKANGYDVDVTNWAFSGHGLSHIFGGNPCTYNSSCKGKVHENYLTDRYFDYVFFNSARSSQNEDKFIDDVTYIMNFFREANPDVKFVLMGTASTQGVNQLGDVKSETVLSTYKNLEKQGVIIADWGEVVAGVIKGKYTVPGAKQEYSRSSFIVSDNYHLNALGGYITTLTAYCAVTGEQASGMTYDFYNDTSLNPKFDISAYINKYYTNGTSDTNFHHLFQSESDMKGLQMLIDKILKEKPYREY